MKLFAFMTALIGSALVSGCSTGPSGVSLGAAGQGQRDCCQPCPEGEECCCCCCCCCTPEEWAECCGEGAPPCPQPCCGEGCCQTAKGA